MLTGSIRSFVSIILYAYLLVLVLKAVMSWFPIAYDSPLQVVVKVLDALTEPLLRPLRRVIPPLQVGGFGLDMSFLVLFLVVFLLQTVLL